MSQRDEQKSTQTGKQPARPARRWPRRIWRVIKWVLITLLVLLIVLAGLVAWVGGTNAGTAFAWHQANRFLPDMIHIDRVEGRLIGPLHMGGVDYTTESMKAHVGSIDFDMDFSAIWSRTIHVKHLDVNQVDYEVLKESEPAPEEPAGEPFSMPDQINLPVSVIVDRLSVANVTAITAPKAEPVKVDRIALEGARLDNAQWQIASLTGHGPLFDLDAGADVTPGGGYATNLHASAKLRLPDYAPIDATADIQGSLDDLALDIGVAAPYNLSVTGHVTDALTALAVDARVQVDDLQTAKIADSLPVLTANADVAAKGPINDLGVTLDADVDSQDYGRATLDGGVRYTPSQVTIQALKLGVPATQGQLVANGDVALAEGNAMDVTVDWQNLAWPLSAKPQYKSRKGRLALKGALSDYDLTTRLDWQVVGQTAGTLAAEGSGSTEAFKLAQLTVDGGPGTIRANADARWAPALDVTAHVEGSHINPGAIVADVPGDFDLVTDVSASQPKDGTLTATVKKLTANGSLRGQPLDLNARAKYLGDHVNVDTLHLVSGAATADVKGTFGWTPNAALNGQWSIHSTDLGTIMPGLAGRLDTEGQVKGRVKAPIANATLTADDIDAFGNKVGHASLDANIDWSGNTRSRVDLAAEAINAGGQDIRRVALNLDGTPARHDLSLNLDSDIAKADLALNGSLNKSTYKERFTLNRLTASYDQLAPWSLAGPATGAVSTSAQSLSDACLRSGEAQVCLTGSHDAKTSVAKIDLSNFNYDYAKPYFPEGLAVTGAISGTVDARLPTGAAPRVAADLSTTAGKVTMTTPTGDTVEALTMQPGQIVANMANNGVDARVDLPFAGNDGIQANVSVAEGASPLTEHALNGRLRLDKSLAVLADLSPEVDTFDGSLSADLSFSGTVARPNILGDAELSAAKIVLVTPGLTLTDVSLAANGQGNAIGIAARARSGGGTLAANGQIALDDTGQTVQLAITGDRFQVANIPDATAYVSPDLNVEVTPDKVSVTGSVTIPEAAITPKDLPESGVTTVSSDQVIVTDENKTTDAVARAIAANVKVILGDKVRIEAFGLKANLEGNLRVVQNPGDANPTGTGAIEVVDGSYRAYGQSLDIQSGKILFAGGPVSQPGLDIRAARYPDPDVTVGVHVRGSLSEPELTLFSDPTMTQSEQLSWLLLGRALDQTSGQQSSLVARAALALGSSKGNQVLQNIGDKLGVDVGLGAGAGESSSETALTVGRYLSPRLYVSYGLGLFDQVSTVSMRYSLSSHWALETSSSGQATGGDIIWTFDR
ncbi:translocation/assembly module TamB domain-containing protein [uncultured Salinisphaera sp.]|uniref:translocation/assembly module TamB domain-containing protein n=1 Tax=uncultured Salinisphaera sp. TaxID=359372 RepID=UPI0032B1E887